MKFKKYIAASMIALAGLTACSDSFLDIDYTEYLDEEAAGEAAGKNPDVFLNGMWSWMVTAGQTSTSHDDFGYMGSLHATDMMGQDICMAASHWFNFDYQLDNRMEAYRRTKCHWVNFYTMIAKANEIISLYPEGGETISQKGLLGQAYAIRGLSYMHLIQLYQFTIDKSGNINTDAPGVPLIYVDADGKNYIDASVANGFLARYYLLSQQWEKAAAAASKARANYTIMDSSSSGLYDGFVTVNNVEWMWGFAHTTETQTTYASFFSMISNIAPGYAGMGYACSRDGSD